MMPNAKRYLVGIVSKLLGKPPIHVYDYGMQPEWKKHAYQWVADLQRPAASFPIHCWSVGYGPSSPLTWFKCKTCGEAELGSPDALPERACLNCLAHGRQPRGWEVADERLALTGTLRAAEGMSAHLLSKVFQGPGA